MIQCILPGVELTVLEGTFWQASQRTSGCHTGPATLTLYVGLLKQTLNAGHIFKRLDRKPRAHCVLRVAGACSRLCWRCRHLCIFGAHPVLTAMQVL